MIPKNGFSSLKKAFFIAKSGLVGLKGQAWQKKFIGFLAELDHSDSSGKSLFFGLFGLFGLYGHFGLINIFKVYSNEHIKQSVTKKND